MPPASGFFGGSPQAIPPGQQPQQQQQQQPTMPGGSNYNLLPPPFSNNSAAAPTSNSISAANSPVPAAAAAGAASSEMNSVAAGNPPSISSPLDSKKDILQNKLLSPLSSGYQGSTDASSQNADPLLQGGGIPSLPSVKIKEEPVSSSMGLQGTSSPHPPPSVEMNQASSIPSIHSLPPVDSKKDIFLQTKVPTPPSSGFQELPAPASQSGDPLLQGGGVPSVTEPKSASGGHSNQKIVPEPSLLKGKYVAKPPISHEKTLPATNFDG